MGVLVSMCCHWIYWQTELIKSCYWCVQQPSSFCYVATKTTLFSSSVTFLRPWSQNQCTSLGLDSLPTQRDKELLCVPQCSHGFHQICQQCQEAQHNINLLSAPVERRNKSIHFKALHPCHGGQSSVQDICSFKERHNFLQSLPPRQEMQGDYMVSNTQMLQLLVQTSLDLL